MTKRTLLKPLGYSALFYILFFGIAALFSFYSTSFYESVLQKSFWLTVFLIPILLLTSFFILNSKKFPWMHVIVSALSVVVLAILYFSIKLSGGGHAEAFGAIFAMFILIFTILATITFVVLVGLFHNKPNILISVCLVGILITYSPMVYTYSTHSGCLPHSFNCIKDWAVSEQDITKCDMITLKAFPAVDMCYQHYISTMNDPALCEKYYEGHRLEQCLTFSVDVVQPIQVR